MGFSVKEKIARSLSHNRKLNKRTLQVKKSWDEVSNLLSAKQKRRK
ncbi:MAG: hypothetical protein PWP24_1262 [Clostridiales bacterium]|nr:hypothetical protein [Clostridiales bacterium]